MAGLQRSAVSFRRQGSSGLVWDDKFLAELNQIGKQKEEQEQLHPDQQQQQQQDSQQPQQEHEKLDNNKDVKPSLSVNTTTTTTPTTIERSRSNGGGRGYRTGRVSPAIEPPSPRVSACGFCSAFAKPSKTTRTKKSDVRERGSRCDSPPWDQEREGGLKLESYLQLVNK